MFSSHPGIAGPYFHHSKAHPALAIKNRQFVHAMDVEHATVAQTRLNQSTIGGLRVRMEIKNSYRDYGLWLCAARFNLDLLLSPERVS